MTDDEQQQQQQNAAQQHRQHQHETADGPEWLVSFSAAMVPFIAFVYSHSRGLTGRAIDFIIHRSPVGVYGLLGLPFVTLGMEKCIYDTVQSVQGINPNVLPADGNRGGFPSGGANLPSFSLVPVQPRNLLSFSTTTDHRHHDMTALDVQNNNKNDTAAPVSLLKRLTNATLDSVVQTNTGASATTNSTADNNNCNR